MKIAVIIHHQRNGSYLGWLEGSWLPLCNARWCNRFCYDATIPPNKGEILARADEKVAAIDEDYEMGLMSDEERHKQIVDIWNAANEEVGEAMANNFDKFNPIYMMAFSGARGNIKQIRQLAVCVV